MMKNLPRKKDEASSINGKVILSKDSGEFIGYRIQDQDGWLITDISAATHEGIANLIAGAIREARDNGFEQGREHIRNALGIDKKWGS